MPYQPLAAILVTEQLGAGHPEHAPALEPQPRIGLAISLLQDRHHRLAVSVLVLQPGIGGLLVVLAGQQPALFDGQLVLEMQQGVGSRHQPAGEEVPAHPVVLALGLERIHQVAVAENVHEQLAARHQPSADAPHERLVVAHVFEHLDRNHAIEGSRFQLQPVDVAGDDLDVEDRLFAATRLDVLALRPRIGDRGDARVGILARHPHRQRAPAAAQFEDALAVCQLRALAVERQHVGFGHAQVAHPVLPVAAAVLEVLAQAQLEELRRQLVVLAVGRVGLDRDLAAAQRVQHRSLPFQRMVGATCAFVLQPLPADPADAHAQQRVRYAPTLGPAGCRGLGGHGRGTGCTGCGRGTHGYSWSVIVRTWVATG